MSTKHTPRPWQTDDNFGCKSIRAPQSETEICYTVGNADEDVDESNAKLLAASPDLLDALTELRKWCQWLSYNEGDSPMERGARCASPYDVEKLVNAAIAKAEGR